MKVLESFVSAREPFADMPKITSQEAIIAVIPDESQEHRIVFVAKAGGGPMPIILRQESYSPGVGWFTQNQIEMTRQQMAMLRATLGVTPENHSRGNKLRKRPQRVEQNINQKEADAAATVLPFASSSGRERMGA